MSFCPLQLFQLSYSSALVVVLSVMLRSMFLWCRDESLLCQGLALNDDLQRVLAKHESISSGSIPFQSENKKPEPAQALVNINAPLIDTGDKQSEKG